MANITLSTNSPEDLEEQAISQAIQDAKSKAKETAKASGKRLGRLISLTSGATGQVGVLTSRMGTEPQPGVGVLETERETERRTPEQFWQEAHPGQIEVVRRVSVVYELRNLPFFF